MFDRGPAPRAWLGLLCRSDRQCKVVEGLAEPAGVVLVGGEVVVAAAQVLRLIDEPPVARSVTARPGSLDELRGEALHPSVDADVIDGDVALGQQFLDIAVGQPVPQIPADRDGDHLPREPEAGKDRVRPRCSHRTRRVRSKACQEPLATRSPYAVAGPGTAGKREYCNLSGLLRACRGVQQKSTATCPDSRGPTRALRDGDLRG